MTAEILPLTTFHLTGDKSGAGLTSMEDLNLRPALFTGYRDLTKLRYDYPMLLIEGSADAPVFESLSRLIDGVLRQIAPEGMEGERLRRQVLSLESEIRAAVAAGERGKLSKLMGQARKKLLAKTAKAETQGMNESLDRIQDALAQGVMALDGEVIDCDGQTPVRLLSHAWHRVEAAKAEKFHAEVGALIVKLREILRANYMHTEEARTPEALKGAVGSGYEAAFDFAAMSDLLNRAGTEGGLPEKRRKRIAAALAVLEEQKFFAPAEGQGKKGKPKKTHEFLFTSCLDARQAFEARLEEMARLVKAISIAELEIPNNYREDRHDSFFKGFVEQSLTAQDLAIFPSYLICLGDGRGEDEKAVLLDLLSSGLPMKVLVQTDDILARSPVGEGRFSFGIKSLQLASMAVGLNSAFVLQSSASHLRGARGRILAGLTYNGPALFSIYSGAAAEARGFPAYLSAAAAMQSRAFPAFSYDPTEELDWAARFVVDDNPQPERDWPRQVLDYQDEELQKASQEVAFTFVDFVACDARYGRHFARVAPDKWHGDMVDLRQFLGHGDNNVAEKVPYILMIDEDDVLQRVIVEDKLIEAANRCTEMWHSLQELGGINSAHAKRLLAVERAKWEEEKAAEIEALRGQAAPPPTVGEPASAANAEAAAEEEAEPEEAPPSDEPYIETPRCTTCNECTDINNKMFTYNENMQASVADPTAGTFKEMVEAAEVCQVAIIHPGKPKNPDEPGLEDLIKRAAEFN